MASGEAKSKERSQRGWAFEDQRIFLVWLQDNAAGLAINKTSVVLFGHNSGGWSLCHQVLQPNLNKNSETPLFVAAIMQSGFCDDIQGKRRARHSEEILEPIGRSCRGKGQALVECLNALKVETILSLGGDILTYNNYWTRPVAHNGAAVSINANRGDSKTLKSTRFQKVNSRKSFWPWGMFTKGDELSIRKV